MRESTLLRRHIAVLFLVVSLLMVTASVYSQETTGRIGVASTTFRDDRGDSSLFGPVIANIVAFELEEAGFYTESLMGETETDGMFQQAADRNIDLLLVNRYTVEGEQIALTSSCYYVPEQRILAEVTGSGDINLSLDGVIQQILQDIIDRVEELVNDLPTLARIDEEPAVSEMAPETPDETAESLSDIDVEQETQPEPAEADTIEEQPTTITAEIVQPGLEEPEPDGQPDGPEKKFRRFEFSLGFAPFFPVGGASRYFTLGLEPWLYTGFRFRAGLSSITLGAYGGVNIFTAQGLLITSENLLISSGLDLRLLTREADILRVGFRLAGGAAFLMVNPNDRGYQTSVVPFGSGGLSVDIGLGVFAFAFQFNFTAYFEQSVIIMGFSPGGQVSLRL